MPIAKPTQPPVVGTSPNDANAVLEPALTATPQTLTLGPPGDAANASTNDGKTITMPTVKGASLPKVEGLDIQDRGEDAEFEVVHGYVGQHRQGSRLKRADFQVGTDFNRLVDLGAVKVLKDEVNLDPVTEDEASPPSLGSNAARREARKNSKVQ